MSSESTPEQEGFDVPTSEQPTQVDGSSIMGRLRQRHAELLEGKTLDLSIPGYSDELVARYRVLDVSNEIQRINQRNAQHKTLGEQMLWGTVDALATACEEIFYNDGENLRPLSESLGKDEPPVMYDERLAEFLGFKAHDAREVVYQTFGGAQGEPAILAHGRRLSQWMANTDRGVMDTFLGEL